MRLFALGLFLLAASSAAADESARFAFVAAENGVFRLDTWTGAVSLCTAKNGALICLSTPAAGAEHAPAGSDDTEALEARVAALEAAAGNGRSGARDDAMGRVKILAERMMRRLAGLVREMNGETL